MRPRRIAVDWDSTLATEVWPGIGDWLPGAVDALKLLSRLYDEVVIFTLRVAPVDVDEVTPRDPYDQVVAIGKMLTEAGIPLNVYIWDKPYKPPCEFFIDDRNIPFSGDWTNTLAHLAVRRVTNHKEETVAESSGTPIEPWRPMSEAPVWIDEGTQVCGCNGRCGQGAMDTPGDVIEQMEKESWEETRDEDGIYVPEAKRTYDPASEPNAARVEDQVMRQFETGATRNVDVDQLDYEGFLSPLSLWAFASYMHKNRFQADGNIRDSDNWQKGIPVDSYRKSLIRHVMDVWLNERGFSHLSREDTVTALCAILFNAGGMLHELLKADI